MKIFKIIEKNFGFLLIVSAILAFYFPHWFLWGENLIDEFLMFALFLGCLKINFSEIFHIRENFLKILFFAFLNTIIFPVVFYYLSFFLDQEIRLGFFLLFGVSSGVLTPILAGFFDLKILWSIVFVVLSSIIVPFSVPFLLELLFKTSVEISTIEMVLFLTKIIFIPAILAIVFKKIFSKIIKLIFLFSGGLGGLSIVICLGIIIAVNQDFLFENLFHFSTIPIVIGLCFLVLFKFMFGFYLPFVDQKERWTNSLMFGIMNNGLIILLATEFLTEKVLFVVLLSEIPYVLCQSIFQKILQKFYKNKNV